MKQISLLSIIMSLPSSFHDKAALYQHIKRQLNLYIGMSGLSQSELGRRLGVSRGTVTNWLRTGKISKENLVKLCLELKISEQDILSADLHDFEKNEIPLTDLQKDIIKKIQHLPKEEHYLLVSISKILS
ncbi:helix-turn-helix transcriptional regulator [Vibrio parahaemolyticus]|nr:helix-turn-helix transcriptional regulator [Vibrio parahaemolyticus]